MTSIQTLFDQNQAGFTVYSPDCTQSRLWGHVDHLISAATDFRPIYRQWIYHDYNSIMRFYTPDGEDIPPSEDPAEAARRYENIPVENLQYGHFVVRLFLSGPSLLTIWQGENAVETLLKVKGATHPVNAAPDTIRGGLWCDNAVCNLSHTSDDIDEAMRELGAVGLSPILSETPRTLDLLPQQFIDKHYISHSGIVVLYDVIMRHLFTINNHPQSPPDITQLAQARLLNNHFVDALSEVVDSHPNSLIADLIQSYLAGDLVEVTNLLARMPATQWERFAIQCSTINRDKWQPF